MHTVPDLTQRGTGDRRPVVIAVLGARSGTSALAGTLGILGCTLPKNLMPPNFANTKGYFEPQDLAQLHDSVLASVGSSWHDWREFPQSWFASEDALTAKDTIRSAYFSNFGQAPLAVLKEPRMCRILPLWRQIFNDLGVRPAFCFIDRNPVEVAMSLRARDDSSIEQGLRYYIRNHLEAERDTRDYRRAVISYDELLSDWRHATAKALKALGVALQPTAEQAKEVDEFLEQGMRHLTLSPDEHPNNSLSEIAFAIHSAYGRLARGEPEEQVQNSLNEIRIRFDEMAISN